MMVTAVFNGLLWFNLSRAKLLLYRFYLLKGLWIGLFSRSKTFLMSNDFNFWGWLWKDIISWWIDGKRLMLILQLMNTISWWLSTAESVMSYLNFHPKVTSHRFMMLELFLVLFFSFSQRLQIDVYIWKSMS